MHCTICKANSKDNAFSIHSGLESAASNQCEACYWVWWPLRDIYDWKEYCEKVSSDAKFKEWRGTSAAAPTT